MRTRMRAIRQNVCPAPGPARTSTGCEGASIASCWESDGECGKTGGEMGTAVNPSPRVTATLFPDLDQSVCHGRKLACVPETLGDAAESRGEGVLDLLLGGSGLWISALPAEEGYLQQRQRIDIGIPEGNGVLKHPVVVEQRFLIADP